RDAVGAGDLHPLPDIVAVVVLGLVGDGRLGPARLLDQLALGLDRVADPALALLEPAGEHVLGDLGCALLVELPGVLGAARLDHHDGDVAFGVLAPGDDELEGRLVALLVGRVGQPAPLDRPGDADRADRAVAG